MAKDFNDLSLVDSGKKGGNFPDLLRYITAFKGWLRGMHHKVENLRAYIDEYYYRLNRNNMKEGIFENLLTRKVKAELSPYKKQIIT